MNPKFLFSLIHSHIIILFSLLIRITLSDDANSGFLTCQPKTCGNNQNISYPFYIKDKQPPYCGNPGFELTCSQNGFPILNLINSNYSIQEIFYNNHTIRISNPVFSEPNTASNSQCVAPAQNLAVGKYRFQIGSNQRDMLLFYGCDLTSEGMQENKIGCFEENRTRSVLGFYSDDPRKDLVRKNCTGRVVYAKVENGKGGIREALRNGFLLNWNATNCSACMNSGGKCGFDTDPAIYAFRCYCRDRVHAADCDSESKKLSNAGKLGIVLSAGFLSILIIGLLLVLYKRKHGSSGGQFETRNSSSNSSSNLEIETSSVYFKIPHFSYKELEEATNHFAHDKHIGDGGFGTVYYGKLQDGREVAVKRLYEHNYRRVEQFMNEIQILTRLRHKNLVSLYGCTSRQSRELLLVYEFIPNGTVACHLHGELAKPGSMPWSTRIKIAIETASALAYLHASEIIHRDVKTNNILLDNSYSVKVADFGLSRLFPENVTHVSTAPQGTPGYVDPEYYQCYQLTSKSDVYSFGVVLIELISSKPAVDMSRSKDEINLSSLAVKKIQKSELNELVDHSLGFDSDNEVKRMMVLVAELAFQCLQRDKELRPSMDEVLEVLKRIESGKDNETEDLVEVEVHGVGISHSKSNNNVHLPPPPSPEWDEVGLLKNKKLTSSPITVMNGWESKSTTPNVSV